MRKIGYGIMIFLSYSWLHAADTKLNLYRPYAQLKLNIHQEQLGECLGLSQIMSREDAWRCKVQDKILDPCFVHPHGNQQEVLCPQSPWAADIVRLKLSKTLYNIHSIDLDMSKMYPWAVELDDGDRCLAVESGQLKQDLAVHYQCKSMALLVGHIQRCNPHWHILMEKNGQLIRVGLQQVWF